MTYTPSKFPRAYAELVTDFTSVSLTSGAGQGSTYRQLNIDSTPTTNDLSHTVSSTTITIARAGTYVLAFAVGCGGTVDDDGGASYTADPTGNVQVRKGGVALAVGDTAGVPPDTNCASTLLPLVGAFDFAAGDALTFYGRTNVNTSQSGRTFSGGYLRLVFVPTPGNPQ